MDSKHIRKEDVIDYYVFVTKTGDISAYMDLSLYENPRERTFYRTHQEDVLLAKEKGKLGLLDLRKNEIVDENGKKLNLEGKTVYPICSISQGENLLNCISKAKGKSITSIEDSNIILHWFDLVKPQRKFEEFQNLQSLYKDLDRIKEEYGEIVFIKTIKKHFSNLCWITSKLHKDVSNQIYYYRPPTFYIELKGTVKENENVLLFESVEIKKDENGINREWRAFVIENSLWCLSRCYGRHIDIEDYVIKKVKEKIKEFERIMPKSYCVDFFEYEKDGKVVFDVLEFNPIVGAGVYKHNDLVF